MANTGPVKSIGDLAAEWAVETAHGEMTPEKLAELNTWLAADRRHQGAYTRARAWLRATENAIIDTAAEARRIERTPKRPLPAPVSDNDNMFASDAGVPGSAWHGLARWSRRAMAGGAAVAMVAMLLIAQGVPLPLPFGQSSQRGSEEIVHLKDGSVVTLGSDAKIQVVLSANARQITLLGGQATFKVAKDKARPFVVRSGQIYAQATGTIYSVRRVGPTGGTVKVAEGSVLVWPHDERDQAVLVHEGGMITLDPGPGKPARAAAALHTPPPAPPPVLAQISLDNVPVKMAIQRFNRINNTKIVLDDPSIGEMRIIGLYKANEPETFAKAVATISGGIIVRNGETIFIKMKHN